MNMYTDLSLIRDVALEILESWPITICGDVSDAGTGGARGGRQKVPLRF